MCIVKGVNIKIGKVDQKDKFVWNSSTSFLFFFFFQFNDLLRLLLIDSLWTSTQDTFGNYENVTS